MTINRFKTRRPNLQIDAREPETKKYRDLQAQRDTALLAGDYDAMKIIDDVLSTMVVSYRQTVQRKAA